MRSKEKVTPFVILTAVILLVALGVGIMLTAPPNDNKESVNEVMQNAVLHETDKIDLFGIMQVNPSVISAYTVTAILLVFAALVRIFAIPRFKLIPGAFQSLIEKLVELFDNMAKSYSPYHNGFLGAYIFAAGCYVFFGTVFELFGIPAVNAHGLTVSLPAPLSDINGAAAMGIMSYSVILGAGIYFNGLRGLGGVLKDFSLPLSMSFRMFGALLSGLLVTELVYYTISLSFVVPVIVGVLFTLLHAIVQTYVLIMLTSTFFGEASEPHVKKEKNKAVKA